VTAVDVHAKCNKKDYEMFKTLNDQMDWESVENFIFNTQEKGGKNFIVDFIMRTLFDEKPFFSISNWDSEIKFKLLNRSISSSRR
jgi:hypothetical protein